MRQLVRAKVETVRFDRVRLKKHDQRPGIERKMADQVQLNATVARLLSGKRPRRPRSHPLVPAGKMRPYPSLVNPLRRISKASPTL